MTVTGFIKSKIKIYQMDGFFRSDGQRSHTVAVVGSGISGLSAAWMLSKSCAVTLYEKDARLGGHSNTVQVEGRSGPIGVDTGFIVFNEVNYPNLTALFDHLDIATKPTRMSFSVSGGGEFEYAGSVGGLLAQPANILSIRVWRMLAEIRRFYRDAPATLNSTISDFLSLGEYLEQEQYSDDFINHHILPMGAAIWSTPLKEMTRYPATSFIKFYVNHGLFKFTNRPLWRTVVGGSEKYISALAQSLNGAIKKGCGVGSIRRSRGRAILTDYSGAVHDYDHVVIATHADDALELLEDPSKNEIQHLKKFQYSENQAVLHSDDTLMPNQRRAWSSWNFIRSAPEDERTSVTYWMNRLQGMTGETPLFVTLNPVHEPKPASVIASFEYKHPIFDADALQAQQTLWNLQGHRHTWFCGSYFGSGFHEDGLQSGLAVGEALGGTRRPWSVLEESGRIYMGSGSYRIGEESL